MTEAGAFNIREICRGCLSDNKDNLRSIFDSNIFETFVLCTNVQVRFTNNCNNWKVSLFEIFPKVTEKDGLPKLICSSCVYKVISWVTFKKQCEQSDGILRTTFQCSENKATTPSASDVRSTSDCRQSVNNLLVTTNDPSGSQSKQISGIDDSNASELEGKTGNDGNRIEIDQQADEADEDEVKLK